MTTLIRYLSEMCSSEGLLRRSQAVSLLLNASVIVSKECPELSREAFVGAIVFRKDLDISVGQLRSSIGRISRPAASAKAYVESMLSYSVRRFLKETDRGGRANLVRDFPMQLLDCKDATHFVKKYEAVLVPLLMWHQPDADRVRELAQMLDKDVSSVCLDNFPRLMGYTLPHLTVEGEARNSSEARAKKKANQLHRAVDDSLKIGETMVNDELNEHIAQVLAQVG